MKFKFEIKLVTVCIILSILFIIGTGFRPLADTIFKEWEKTEDRIDCNIKKLQGLECQKM